MVGKTDFGKIRSEMERDERRANGETFSPDKLKYLSPPVGDTQFMIGPPLDDNSDLYFDIWIHFIKDGTGKTRALKCAKKNFKECPICNKADAMIKEADDLEKDGKTAEAKEIRDLATGHTGIKAKHFFLYNAANMQLENVVLTLKPLTHQHVRAALASFAADEDIDPTEFENGRIIKVTRMKTQPYAMAKVLNKTMPMDEKEVAKLVRGLIDLTKVYKDYTPDEMNMALNGENIWNSKDVDDSNGVDTEVKCSDSNKTKESVETKTKSKPSTNKKSNTIKTHTPEPTSTNDDDDDIAELDALLNDE